MLKQIEFIRRAQYLGFSLEEIKGLFEVAESGTCKSGRAFAQAKCEELGRRVRELNRMRRSLKAYVKRCDANKRGAPCPFVLALSGDET
jgi:MerR family mercuric resistance operon transcriptional regulator